jgi:hypothetical protein
MFRCAEQLAQAAQPTSAAGLMEASAAWQELPNRLTELRGFMLPQEGLLTNSTATWLRGH